jgi:hypothetical protein
MGAILDDLSGHEGYPLRQLPDGTTPHVGPATRPGSRATSRPANAAGSARVSISPPRRAVTPPSTNGKTTTPVRCSNMPSPTGCRTCCETRCGRCVTSQSNGPMPQPRRCAAWTPGARISHDGSTSASPCRNHPHVESRCGESNRAGASALGSSHAQVPVLDGAHPVGTVAASPHGRARLVGEDRRSLGPHCPRSQGGTGPLRAPRRPTRTAQSDRTRPSRRARHAGAHERARAALGADASDTARSVTGQMRSPSARRLWASRARSSAAEAP